MAIFTIFIFPLLASRIGRINSFRYGQLLFAFCSLCVATTPLIKYYLWGDLPLFMSLLAFTSFAKMFACMAFTANFLLINSSVTPEKRASVNGLGMTFGSIAKALGPACGSVLYAWSINNRTMLPTTYSYLISFLCNLAIAALTFYCLPTSSLCDGPSSRG